MAKSKMIHFEKYSVIESGVSLKLDLSRFEKQFQTAQYELDGMVMESMVPFMPMVDNAFIAVTRGKSASVQGTGEVYAAFGPQGRFLYNGKTMVDEKTGSPYARLGAKKVLVSNYAGKTKAKEDLKYSLSAHPLAQSHWFDAAKEKDLNKWLKKTKKIAGGSNGS